MGRPKREGAVKCDWPGCHSLAVDGDTLCAHCRATPPTCRTCGQPKVRTYGACVQRAGCKACNNRTPKRRAAKAAMLPEHKPGTARSVGSIIWLTEARTMRPAMSERARANMLECGRSRWESRLNGGTA